jgi:hypothetical protein
MTLLPPRVRTTTLALTYSGEFMEKAAHSPIEVFDSLSTLEFHLAFPTSGLRENRFSNASVS